MFSFIKKLFGSNQSGNKSAPVVGSPAPDFSLPDHTGANRSLGEYRGAYTVIYFYPKDDTPGCTIEACTIRDAYGEFGNEGIAVLGVSADSPESHMKFREKYELPFTLLSDMNGSMIASYGADGFGYTKRISYLLDPSGIVAKIYPEVDPSTHAMQIINDVRSMKSAA